MYGFALVTYAIILFGAVSIVVSNVWLSHLFTRATTMQRQLLEDLNADVDDYEPDF